MSEVSSRFATVAARFSEVAESVPPGGWVRPAPCEGWVARDVVRHLVEWVPPFLRSGAGIDLPAMPPVDVDPAAAWDTLRRALQAVLDDAEQSAREFTNEHTGTHRVDDAIARFVLGDVLVHTWDLARATGADETLDPDEVRGMVAGLEPLGDLLERSGHYAARVPVPPDADQQTRLLALTGRRP